MPHVVNGRERSLRLRRRDHRRRLGHVVPRHVLPGRARRGTRPPRRRARAARAARRAQVPRARPGSSSCPTSWASAARSGTRKRAAPSSAWACTTSAATSTAPCSKASASRCSTTSRPERAAASRSTTRSPSWAARRARTCGCRSSPTSPAGRCSASDDDAEASLGAAMLAALGTGVVAAPVAAGLDAPGRAGASRAGRAGALRRAVRAVRGGLPGPEVRHARAARPDAETDLPRDPDHGRFQAARTVRRHVRRHDRHHLAGVDAVVAGGRATARERARRRRRPLDDVGFGGFGCYGSEIATPTHRRARRRGPALHQLPHHARCARRRAPALLTGRNHHAVGIGCLADCRQRLSRLPRHASAERAATLAEMLGRRLQHHMRRQVAPGAARPRRRRPGPYDQLAARPRLRPLLRLPRRADRPVRTPTWSTTTTASIRPARRGGLPPHRGPGRPGDRLHRATTSPVGPSGRSSSTSPSAPRTAPHQAPQPYLEKYRGRYDEGWDVDPRAALARQLELGIVRRARSSRRATPACVPWDEPVGRRAEGVSRGCRRRSPAWSSTPTRQIGRVWSTISRAIGQLDNTLIVVLSDNGASQEGGAGRLDQRDAPRTTATSPTVADKLARIDEIGGPRTHTNYPQGWAQASATRRCKPLQAEHPRRRRARAAGRVVAERHRRRAARSASQFHHVIDVVPTLLDLAGVDAPAVHQGVPQLPIHGVSLRYSFADADGADRKADAVLRDVRRTAAIWHDGWKAVSFHRRGNAYDQDTLGALPPRRGFLGVQRPRRAAAGAAAGLIELMVGRGAPLRRAAARRPRLPRARGQVPDAGFAAPALPARALSGNGAHPERRRAADDQPVVSDRRPPRRDRRGARGRRRLARRPERRLHAVRQRGRLVFEYNHEGTPYRVESREGAVTAAARTIEFVFERARTTPAPGASSSTASRSAKARSRAARAGSSPGRRSTWAAIRFRASAIPTPTSSRSRQVHCSASSSSSSRSSIRSTTSRSTERARGRDFALDPRIGSAPPRSAPTARCRSGAASPRAGRGWRSPSRRWRRCWSRGGARRGPTGSSRRSSCPRPSMSGTPSSVCGRVPISAAASGSTSWQAFASSSAVGCSPGASACRSASRWAGGRRPAGSRFPSSSCCVRCRRWPGSRSPFSGSASATRRASSSSSSPRSCRG